MKGLSDLIAERQREITEAPRLSITPHDASWLRAKKIVNDLPQNYEDNLRKALKDHPERISKRRIGGGYAIEISMTIEGYECELYIAENFAKEVKKAGYYLWDYKNNNVYIKDLLNPIL